MEQKGYITTKDGVLNLLQTQDKVYRRDAEKVGSDRLSARVWDLKHIDKYDILTFYETRIIHKGERKGCKKREVYYMLWEKVCKYIKPETVCDFLASTGWTEYEYSKSGKDEFRWFTKYRKPMKDGKGTVAIPLDQDGFNYPTYMKTALVYIWENNAKYKKFVDLVKKVMD